MIATHRRPGRARLGPVLVSVVIILICAGVMIPKLSEIRQTAQRLSCQGRNKQLGLAIHNFESAMNRFPAGTMPNEKLPPEKRFSWLFAVTPYIEANDIYRRANFELAWDDENQFNTGFSYAPFNCLHDRSRTDNVNTATYLCISGVGTDAATYPLDHPDAGIFGYDRTLKLSDIQNTSSTLMILETRRAVAKGWTFHRSRDRANDYFGDDQAFRQYASFRRAFLLERRGECLHGRWVGPVLLTHHRSQRPHDAGPHSRGEKCSLGMTRSGNFCFVNLALFANGTDFLTGRECRFPAK